MSYRRKQSLLENLISVSSVPSCQHSTGECRVRHPTCICSIRKSATITHPPRGTLRFAPATRSLAPRPLRLCVRPFPSAALLASQTVAPQPLRALYCVAIRLVTAQRPIHKNIALGEASHRRSSIERGAKTMPWRPGRDSYVRTDYLPLDNAAWAAASRAIGTRNGLHET